MPVDRELAEKRYGCGQVYYYDIVIHVWTHGRLQCAGRNPG